MVTITPPKWTLAESMDLIRAAQPLAYHAGYHLGIGGGVLNKGYSDNDLDIIVMPLNSDKASRSLEGLWRAFRILGCGDYFDEITKNYPEEQGRVIYRASHKGRDIDLFVYERLPLIERMYRRIRSWFKMALPLRTA